LPRDYSTEAVVLGSHKLGDADRVVTLFTAARGKVPTVVKGVRKLKSKFGGRLEPFTHIQARLHEGRNLHTLTGADTLATHALLRDTPAALKGGLAFIDMLNRATPDFEKSSRRYNLLVRYLDEMDAACRRYRGKDATTTGDVAVFRRLTLAAELKLLLLTGFLPHLGNCAVCGSSDAIRGFSAPVGGIVCEDCGTETFPVTAETVEAMRAMLEQPLAAAAGMDTGAQASGEIWRCIREICRYHLSANLRIEP